MSFDMLYSLNVNGNTEKKNGLTYLSWSWAWARFVEICPDATYEVKKFDGLPYVESNLGIMVYTSVTANGVTHEMWLPVMDGANKAMKSEAYSYKVRSGEKTVNAATMFDVNKTLMRCLVKNLAMFGLGLYIYAGEDLPEAAPISTDKLAAMLGKIKACSDSDSLKAAFEAAKGECVAASDKDSYQSVLAATNERKKELEA